jgi:SanA protein
MFKKLMQMTFRFARDLSLLSLFILTFNRVIFLVNAAPQTFTTESVPTERVAIVFGAALQRNGTPSVVLRDRIEVAVQLYRAGKVEKILMSGDNRFENYNEPESMRQYALLLGVPDEAIVLDYAGRRTYDTCYRAKEIFKVDSAILITQDFHMPRALFLCNSFGIQSMGVESNQYYYFKRSRIIWNVREVFATTAAVWDVYVSKPLPVLGEPEPIFAKHLNPQND